MQEEPDFECEASVEMKLKALWVNKVQSMPGIMFLVLLSLLFFCKTKQEECILGLFLNSR